MNRRSRALVVAAVATTFLLQGKTAAASELDTARVRSIGSQPYREAVAAFLDGTEPKVVGGAIAPERAFAWQVSVGVSWITDPRAAHFCGGTIHSSRWVITAAHCVTDTVPEDIAVAAGTTRLTAGALRHNVRRVIVHREYDSDTFDNDIAVLELFQPLNLDETRQAIPILRRSDEPVVLVADKMLRVSGWGATHEGGRAVEELRYAEVPFVEREVCNRPLAYDGSVTDSMICAGVLAGGVDSCQGDSGGPIVIHEPSPILVGAVSWGDGCGRPNKVGVYTRVSRFADWVDGCVQQPATCND